MRPAKLPLDRTELLVLSYELHHEENHLKQEPSSSIMCRILMIYLLSTSHGQLLFRILAATLPSAVRTGLLPADGARIHPPCGMSAEKREESII